MSVETQLKHVFPFRVLDWKTTFVHGCALFLPHGRVCAVHTTRPTRSRLRFVHSPVRDTTPVRAGVCPRVCSRGPGSPRTGLWTTPASWVLLPLRHVRSETAPLLPRHLIKHAAC